MPDLREKRVELILQQLEDLPTLPAVAVRVLEITADDQTSAADVVKLISSDVSLTTRILQLVHRADSGVRGDVNSVERAVVLLGFEAVRSAVLAVSVFQTFGATEPAGKPVTPSHFSRDEFWKHSVAVACCAELLATQMNEGTAPGLRIDPSEAFVCGLLHDMGKVALDAVLPKSFSRVVEAVDLLRGNIADVERTVIGLDHMVVGKRLAERWQLPATMRDCTWLHGQLPQALPSTVRNPRIVNLISLADLLVREQHLGYSGNYSFSGSRKLYLDALHLKPERVNATMLKLVEQIEPRASALGLGQASSNELYQHALSQANKELGRVSGQLASKNRKLAVRAKFFDALSNFQGELRPDAPPQTVLRAIGQTAIAVLDVKSAAAFSLQPGQDFAEVLVFDATGEACETMLVDCPRSCFITTHTPSRRGTAPEADAESGALPRREESPDAFETASKQPSRPAAGDSIVMTAGEELEWMLSAVSPRLAHDHRYWICLEAEGQCIGGVVWGGMPAESQRLSPQVKELTAVACGWGLALRTAQIREEARTLAEQLADANRRLQTAQNEVLRTRTLITVGEMAAGAAHEMNNPLAVISGRSQLLESQLSDAKLKAGARLIYEQSHRLTDIITDLMDFARPVPPKPVESDLNDLIGHALREAKTHVDPADRQIDVSVQEVPRVLVDTRQITAALVEIIDNALYATEGLTDRKARITLTAAFDATSQRCAVTVADNGCGMDEDVARRAFDPFFSSRPAGRRRGMGLPKALRWVEASGGSIRLDTRPGQGTRLLMLLPAAPLTASDVAQDAEAQDRRAAQ